MKFKARVGDIVLWCIVSCVVTACSSRKIDLLNELPGYWKGQAIHNEQKLEIAFSFERKDSTLKGKFIVPKYGWHIPITRLEIKGTSLHLASGDSFTLNQYNRLVGVLPSVLVPEYEIPFEMRKQNASPMLDKLDTNNRVDKKPDLILDLNSGAIWGSVSVDDQFLYVGTVDNHVICLDPKTGRIIWKTDVYSGIRGSIYVAPKHLYFYTDSGAMIKMAKSGEVVWEHYADKGALNRITDSTRYANYDYYSGSPVFEEGIVYYGTHQGAMVALNDKTKTIKWSFNAKGAIRSTPVIRNDNIYFGSFDGFVYALDKKTGELNWSFDSKEPIVSTPLVSGNNVIIGSRSYDLWSLDAKTGVPKWKYYCWFSWIESSARIDDSTIYIGSSDAQHIYALNIADGIEKWAYHINGSAWSKPTVHNNTVYAGTLGTTGYFVNHLARAVAIDKGTGMAKWTYSFPKVSEGYYGFSTAPVLLGNYVWFGATDGKIYGFAL